MFTSENLPIDPNPYFDAVIYAVVDECIVGYYCDIEFCQFIGDICLRCIIVVLEDIGI